MKKKYLIFTISVVCAAVLMGIGNASAETLKTPIGSLSFTHDFANGYPTDATGRAPSRLVAAAADGVQRVACHDRVDLCCWRP